MAPSLLQNLARLALALPLLVGVVGSSGCEPRACTLDARTSLILTVVDAQTNEPVEDATVTFRVDGGELRMPDLVTDRIFLGTEEAGVFTVHIEAPGYEPAEAEYTITEDECHVITTKDVIELTPTT